MQNCNNSTSIRNNNNSSNNNCDNNENNCNICDNNSSSNNCDNNENNKIKAPAAYAASGGCIWSICPVELSCGWPSF